VFDWPRFLRARGIAFVTRGPNVGAGHVGVRCPWCGAADPSQHLSISLRGSSYHCWRNSRAHSGSSRAWLIQALLRCSPEEARQIAGEDAVTATPRDADLSALLASLLAGPREPVRAISLELGPELRPLRQNVGVASIFWGYLLDRGFEERDLRWVAEAYDLRFAIKGVDRYRVVIPVYGADGRLATWTGRSVLVDERLRYRTLPMRPPFPGYSGPLARLPTTDLLLGMQVLQRVANPETLVVAEGPLDALKVSALGRTRGIYGTCLFGLNMSEAQALQIERIATRFRRVVVLLDPDAQTLNLRVASRTMCPMSVGKLPDGVEDPGALTRRSFDKFVELSYG